MQQQQQQQVVSPTTMLNEYVYRDFMLNEIVENRDKMQALPAARYGKFTPREFFVHYPKLPAYVPRALQEIKVLYLQDEYHYAYDLFVPQNSVVLNLGGMREHTINDCDSLKRDVFTNGLYKVYAPQGITLSIKPTPDLCTGETTVLLFICADA